MTKNHTKLASFVVILTSAILPYCVRSLYAYNLECDTGIVRFQEDPNDHRCAKCVHGHCI